MLVVLEQGERIVHELALGGVDGRDIGLVVPEDLVLEAVVEARVLFPVKSPVGCLKSRQTIRALVELTLRCEAQLGSMGLQVADGLDAVLLGSLGGDDQGLAVGRLGHIEPHQVPLLLVLLLDRFINSLGVGFHLRLENGEQRRTRVLGIEVDLSLLECRGDHRARNVKRALDGKASILERQGIDLGDDLALGKILGAHGDGAGSALGTASGERGRNGRSESRRRDGADKLATRKAARHWRRRIDRLRHVHLLF